MRKFIATLLTVIFAWVEIARAEMVIDPFSFAAIPPSISFVGCTVSGSNTNAYTYTDHATGTAAANRKTIVVATLRDAATNFSTSTMTVGGNSASESIDSNDAFSGSVVGASIYIIDNPSGTTATIVLTASEVVTSTSVCVYAAYGLLSSTATATDSGFHTSSNQIDLSTNVDAEGVCVGGSGNDDGTAPGTWTGLTEQADGNMGSSSEGRYTTADYTATTAQTPLTIEIDHTLTADAIGVTACYR